MGGRSVWKGPFFENFAALADPLAVIKTQSRSTTILPSFVGRKFEVHNGKTFVPIFITELMVSKKLGEFAFTRKPFSYKKREGR